jgi:hypothetical protein
VNEEEEDVVELEVVVEDMMGDLIGDFSRRVIAKIRGRG